MGALRAYVTGCIVRMVRPVTFIRYGVYHTHGTRLIVAQTSFSRRCVCVGGHARAASVLVLGERGLNGVGTNRPIEEIAPFLYNDSHASLSRVQEHHRKKKFVRHHSVHRFRYRASCRHERGV